jgi:metal-responsive CopG/Arc/MetJ family transcriptional regulator
MKKRINITLEDEVIKRVDRYASELYTSRSGAITRLIVEATDSSGRPVVTEKE